MIIGINHITFATRHLQTSLNFYQNFLGFDVVAIWKTGAYLTAPGIWLCLFYDKQTRLTPSPDYSHIAFTATEQNIRQLQRKVDEYKVPIWKENKSEGASLYILDPHNHKLEIHCGDLQSRIQHMRASPYENMELKDDLHR